MPRMGLNPDKVVHTAAEIADDGGLDKASLSNVAAVLGVRVPSLYKHVAGLEDLQVRLGTFAGKNLLEQLQSAVAGKEGKDALLALFVAHRKFAAQHPGQFAALVRAPLSAQARRTVDDGVDALLLAIIDEYGIDVPDAAHLARVARSSLVGFSLLESVGSFGSHEDGEADLHALIAFFDQGLAVSGSGARRSGFRLPGLSSIQIPGL